MNDYSYQACAPPPISDLFLALLPGLDAINPQTEYYMNFSTASARPWPKFKLPAPAEIFPKSAGVLNNLFTKMYIIILENEGF